ncbi:MAG: single-stranded DNA-binding protein [Ornithinimicrobium sp.]|uniref:single-stranded DNA-binding protein n=1 Tax=Ornithinimicrobium sp. TaxID=1977084 RepID=UPI003D9B3065
MNDSYVTVNGNLTREPQRKFGKKSGDPFTVFGIAQNHSHRKPDGTFVETGTSYYEVIAFRALGDNCAASLHLGDPVVVYGRLSINNWETEDRHGTTVQIDAGHVGHDLLFGTSSFARGRAAAANHDRIATEVNGAPGQVNSDGEFFEQDLGPEPAPEDVEHEAQVA